MRRKSLLKNIQLPDQKLDKDTIRILGSKRFTVFNSPLRRKSKFCTGDNKKILQNDKHDDRDGSRNI